MGPQELNDRQKAAERIRLACATDPVLDTMKREYIAAKTKRMNLLQSRVWAQIRKEKLKAFKESCRKAGIPLQE